MTLRHFQLVGHGRALSQGGAGTINLNSGGTLQIGVGGTTGALGVDALTNNGTLVFNRSDASTYSGIISGTGAVTKQGAGTLTLTGTSSYTGPTRVDGGSLFVDGRLGNTAVLVASGGLLGGTGTINGAIAVLAGGTLSPGNSPGILTVDSLSLFAGSTTLMEITGTAASLYDQIVFTGSGGLTYGGQLALTMTGSQAYALNTTFNLFKNFVTRSGSFSSVALAAGGTPYDGLVFANVGGGIWETGSTAAPFGEYLRFEESTGNIIVVPEPSTYAMALAGLACGGWQMWRRRRLRQAATLAA
jgi:fibronectin-binding autotransporter adhesin